jgi:hypothetical protein
MSDHKHLYTEATNPTAHAYQPQKYNHSSSSSSQPLPNDYKQFAPAPSHLYSGHGQSLAPSPAPPQSPSQHSPDMQQSMSSSQPEATHHQQQQQQQKFAPIVMSYQPHGEMSASGPPPVCLTFDPRMYVARPPTKVYILRSTKNSSLVHLSARYSLHTHTTNLIHPSTRCSLGHIVT